MLERFRQFWTNVWSPIGDLLLRLGVSPNTVTVVGTLGVCTGALVFFPQGWLLAGVLFITVFVFSDMIDGYMARTSGQVSPFGAFLDSTLDRVEEGLVLTAVAYRFALSGDEFAAAMCVVVVLGSLTVSYTRARAEALGVECKVGLATRPVRVVILSVGLVFAKGAGVFDADLLAPAIYAMAALTAFTVVQRVWHVRNALSERAAEVQQAPVEHAVPADDV